MRVEFDCWCVLCMLLGKKRGGGGGGGAHNHNNLKSIIFCDVVITKIIHHLPLMTGSHQSSLQDGGTR